MAGKAQPGTNESVVVETVDGGLYFNCRNYVAPKRRAYARSSDSGDTFTEFGLRGRPHRTDLSGEYGAVYGRESTRQEPYLVL